VKINTPTKVGTLYTAFHASRPAARGFRSRRATVVNILGENKVLMATTHEETHESTDSQEIDSKYRLIILAAKRSKQLQRGARPRIDIDATKHKPTRIALEEVIRGTVQFHFKSVDEKAPVEA
jgi:DNA-directed RNA polymerase omega subunit